MRAIAAIPTMHSGVQCRSRLEAKWLAMFEILRWPAEYEPLDLEGYVPDVLLRMPSGLIAVEIKPLMWDDSEAESDCIEAAKAKFLAWDGEALIVGASVAPRFGLLREDGEWGVAFAFHCLDCGNRSFAHESLSFRCRVAGCDDRRHVGHGWDAAADFRTASNTVQWRAPR